MEVSVIIPTYNGAHKILNVLRSVEKQTYEPSEVIVVIDGSTDNTASILKAESFNFRNFKIVEQVNGGRAKVRNHGARQATGDLFIFFDDDMRPAADCIFNHIIHHQNHSGSILTGSQIEEITHNSSDLFRYKASLSNKWSESYNQLKGMPLTEQQVFLTAANFSIQQQTFELLGGFDERLTDAEDFDLAIRAFRQGVPLYVDLAAHAWHDDPITCRLYIKRLRQYNQAHLMLQQLKPELYQNKNKFLSPAPAGLKRVFFNLFAQSFWIHLIDQGNMQRVLPKQMRYKLYDFIITANGVYFPDKVRL